MSGDCTKSCWTVRGGLVAVVSTTLPTSSGPQPREAALVNYPCKFLQPGTLDPLRAMQHCATSLSEDLPAAGRLLRSGRCFLPWDPLRFVALATSGGLCPASRDGRRSVLPEASTGRSLFPLYRPQPAFGGPSRISPPRRFKRGFVARKGIALPLCAAGIEDLTSGSTTGGPGI